MHNTFCQYAKCCDQNLHNNSCNNEKANGLPFMEPTPPFQGPGEWLFNKIFILYFCYHMYKKNKNNIIKIFGIL